MQTDNKTPTSSLINDVTGLNPVSVWSVLHPRSVEEIQDALRQTSLPVSVGGGHFSMGGQSACPGSLHIDMRQMNQVLQFAPQAGTLRVQAGLRWAELLAFVDPHELTPLCLPRHANFTVGGSVSANAPGWGVQAGQMVEAVSALLIVLPNGERVEASPQRNARLFFAAIGGYGAVGVIGEVELLLTANTRLLALTKRHALADYPHWLAQMMASSTAAVLHEAELELPAMRRVRSLSWHSTQRHVSEVQRLQGAGRDTRRQRGVAWRNYLSGADLGALEGWQAKHWVRVQQSYCVASERLEAFIKRLREITTAHALGVLGVRLSLAGADPGTLLSWTHGEHSCVVELSLRHPRDEAGREAVAVCARELVAAVLAVGGSYLLGAQPHASAEQFARAYPHASELFALKRELDPQCRLRNSLWSKYYLPWLQASEGEAVVATPETSVFRKVYGRVALRDAFYAHLMQAGGEFAAPSLHAALRRACQEHDEDGAIYHSLGQALPALRERMGGGRYAWSRRQARGAEIAQQLRELVGERDHLSGMLEVAGGGDLLARVAGPMRLRGDIVALDDQPPQRGLHAWRARGARLPALRYLPLDEHAPLASEAVRDNSLDLVCCGAGLHAVAPERLPDFLASLYRVLRPGGLLMLREHDVRNDEDEALASLASHLQALLRGRSWELQQATPHNFASADDWAARLAAAGFSENGVRLARVGDALRHVSMVFVKRGLNGGRT